MAACVCAPARASVALSIDVAYSVPPCPDTFLSNAPADPPTPPEAPARAVMVAMVSLRLRSIFAACVLYWIACERPASSA
jgi:hypothetical protein